MLNIKIDSRKVKAGDTFVAIIGFREDGHDYIEEAIAKGATKLVVSKEIIPYDDVEIEVVEDTKKHLAKYLKDTYSKEINTLKIVGITGTNGKTTTSYLIYQMLQQLHVPVAMIGTLGFYSPNRFYTLQNTTPDILTIYNLLLKAKEDDCKVVVMEVSSHALDQQRLFGIRLSIACFTNLSLDHLDYHGTMKNYLLAKLKILEYLKKDGITVVNQDDKHSEAFIDDSVITIGYQESDYQILKTYITTTCTKILFVYDRQYLVTTKLLGKFNVYNYIMALAVVNQLNYSIEQCIKVTPSLRCPLGRCSIYYLQGATIVIDYAHTPDAIKKMITSFSEDTQGRIITVIGCGGNRDINKRPIIGEIATKYSDYVIFTTDNPRFEEPKKIIDGMIASISSKNYDVIAERKEAIKKAISLLSKGDILLILGKGHEEYQVIQGQKIPYSDIKEVSKYLENSNA